MTQTAPLTQMRDHLVTTALPPEDVGIIDELRALEELKCAAEARQARLAIALDRIRAAETRSDLPGNKPSVHAEIALARRVSPHRGRRLLSLARFLDREAPCTKAAFDAGQITEWRATIISKESCCLDASERRAVDRAVSGDATELSERGDRETEALVRSLAARLDAGAVAERRRRAESERRVSIRPAPDTMVYLTALLPVAKGVGVFAALKAAAATAVGTGEATSIGAAMADELVRRVTGVGQGVGQGFGQGVEAQPVSVRLVMSDAALLDGADDPAQLAEHGAIPAEVARALVADNLESGAKVWLKRLYVRPGTGDLIAMDSRARLFPATLGEFIDLRDRRCRTPFCDSPIRHRDHAQPHADGGPTSADNGQGLCADCNGSKQAPGWTATAVSDDRGHTVVTSTPTGHRYRSRAPALIGAP